MALVSVLHGGRSAIAGPGIGSKSTHLAGPRRHRCAIASSSSSLGSPPAPPFSPTAAAKLVAVIGENAVSPLQETPWLEVMNHMVKRLRWTDASFEMLVFTDESLPENREFSSAVAKADILLGLGLGNPDTVSWINSASSSVPTRICFDSTDNSGTWLGGVKVLPLESPVDRLRSIVPVTKLAKGLKVLDLVTNAWSRHSSDNVCFALLVLIDSYVAPVPLLKNLRATSLSQIQCMAKNCGKEILACLLDPSCRKALDCLTSCAPNDQVCSYRCIVSYETPTLEAISLCILQKNNCLGLSAEIQSQPVVKPLEKFRGQELTHTLAEDIFIGWLGTLKWSWRVAAGQNAAYDHFANQIQLYYRGTKNSMWYDPVFQVETLEGELVWRRRHYRARRGEVPGTFYFTVLDNGVVSKEFWRIVDCADDLSWGLFYYSGAATAAGQSYSGAVLVSPDGMWPGEQHSERVNAALGRCGIKLWEMYTVTNNRYGDEDDESGEEIPLGLPEGSKLHHHSSIVSSSRG
ncbi:hypothetical protein SELMODRAFT_408066 [Selaginella moellendorffii]|uniref:VDE lipocalin domain-containing protein n=1 Tax=Selaginella moellendorffii TaxID=88036 RepID=D8R733_SELML|nr:violaxanthin de-epoxidase, chloroplastic [Selaginella moellendorffii]EFJ31817.1 hypothetical protein SELMODRAFT_408066 [Selaginella moellendorffii]|eukprot:XP_002967218.1 violaxanthin de-epoxidase, chloroplastic [Selaginella moellendorffii]